LRVNNACKRCWADRGSFWKPNLQPTRSRAVGWAPPCPVHTALVWAVHHHPLAVPPPLAASLFFLRHGFSDLVRNRHRHPLSGGTALIFLRRGETEFDTARAPPPLGGSPPGLSGASTVGHRHTLSGARAETAPKGQHLYFVVGVISTSLASHGHSLGPPNC
jgi:hypothetical protein